MGIWIRSQNKKELIECNNFSLNSPNESYVNNARIITNYEIVCYPFEHSHCILGIYSTKEKALKVLDEIEKKIIENNTIVCNEKDWAKYVGAINCVFQMPDDEVK